MPQAADKMEARFRRLARQWQEETGGLSVCRQILRHPNVPEILTLGRRDPSQVFRWYAQDGHLVWSSILWEILGDGPDLSGAGEDVAPGMVGWDVRAVRDAWLRWGREHGYLPAERAGPPREGAE